MFVFTKIGAAISKLVGPNTLHLFDALAAVSISAGVAATASPAFREFAAHHVYVSALAALGPVIGVPLAAKLRKSAGTRSNTSAAEAAKAVKDAIAAAKKP